MKIIHIYISNNQQNITFMCTILNYPFLNGSMNRMKRTKSKTSVSRLLVNRTWQFASGSWQVSRRFDRNSGLLSVDERYECSVVIDVDHELIIVVRWRLFDSPDCWLQRFLRVSSNCDCNELTSRGANVLWSFTMPLWNRSLFADFLSNDLVSDSKSLWINAEKT